MFNRFWHIILLVIALSGTIKSVSQNPMPDYACIGSIKRYYVDPHPGSIYKWKIDGVIQAGTSNEINITWKKEGTYLLEIQEQSAEGCLGPVRSGQVLVTSSPPVSVIISANQTTVCPGTMVTFTATSKNGGSDPFYQWQINGVKAGTNSNTFSINTLTKTDTVSCSLISNNVCNSQLGVISNKINIKIQDEVIPTFNAIGPLILNSVPPSLSTISTNGITGKWSPSKISTARIGTATYTFTPDTGQCAIKTILVITTEIKAVIVGETITGACQQIYLDGSKSIGDIVKYDWSLIDQGGALSNLTGATTGFFLAPTFAGRLPADFRIRLTVTDRSGNTNQAIISINVDRFPDAEIYTSAKPERDGTLIADGKASSGTAISYMWNTSDGKIAGPDNQSAAKLFGAGTYELEITDNHGCKSKKSIRIPSEIFRINVNPDYITTPWVQDTTINVLENDRSNVDFIPGTMKIIDQPKQGTLKINANGLITYMPTERHPGRDYFSYEVCNVVNLCASATVTIDITDSKIIIPGGFSPNGDGINDQLVFSGLEKYAESKLYVYTRSGILVYISLDYHNNWDGKPIKNPIFKLDILPSGVYYYVLKPGGTNRSIKGFVYIAF